MKSTSFQKKTASPIGNPAAKQHLKRFQPLPTLDFLRTVGMDKVPEPAVNILPSQNVTAQAPDFSQSLNQ